MAQNENAPGQKRRSGFFGFLAGVGDELKRVIWPTRSELTNYTAVVFVAVVFVCTLIWVSDFIFARIFNLILG